jgi:hypothetical protein
MMSNWCLTASDSAATARTPPGPASRAKVSNRWTVSLNNNPMRRRSLAPSHRFASLRSTTSSASITNSPHTPFRIQQEEFERGRMFTSGEKARRSLNGQDLTTIWSQAGLFHRRHSKARMDESRVV